MKKARLEIATHGQGLYDLTGHVARTVRESGVREGLALIFVRHTTASLVVQENADPDVGRDFVEFFRTLVPESYPYRHDAEGADDMPSHIRTALTHTSELIPIDDGELALGRWQGLYLFEHRREPHRRSVDVRILED